MRNLNILTIIVGLFLLSISANAQKTVWNLDKSHSSITFSVTHLGISETVGAFNDYTLNAKADKADFSDVKFDVKIQSASVDTKNEGRDKHLKGKDFFNVEKYPTITFKGKSFVKKGKKYIATGDFTMLGVTKEVKLEGSLSKIFTSDNFGTRAGLKLAGVIKRSDFGMNYGVANKILGDNIDVEIRLELIKAEK